MAVVKRLSFQIRDSDDMVEEANPMRRLRRCIIIIIYYIFALVDVIVVVVNNRLKFAAVI